MSTAMRAPALRVAGRRYGPVAQAFHWLVVVLLVAQYSTELVPALPPAQDGRG